MSDASPRLDIRPGMDVYSAYQNQYIGSVVEVWRERAGAPAGRGDIARETGSAHETVHGAPTLVHEEGATVSPAEHVGSKQLGEEMGPFPTIAVGNSGPINQSASRAYATGEGEQREGVVCFAVRPGRFNSGPLSRPLYVPTSAVRSVSMERVVLDVQKDRIPEEWRRKPALPD